MQTASIQQIQLGVSRYINEELAKKKTGLAKYAIHFLEGLFAPRLTSALTSLAQTPIVASTVFDENGNVYISALADAARSALEKSGGKIHALGFVFDQSDVDALINYITL